MESKKELDQKISRISYQIRTEFPGLIKNVNELYNNHSNNSLNNISKNDAKYKLDVMTQLKAQYEALETLLNTYTGIPDASIAQQKAESLKYPALEVYPASEDIYQKSKKESELNPEDPTKLKTPNEKAGSLNEKNFEDDMSGSDLDIPGSELDDQQENIGNEDEENNYYSLGGDDHNDLDEEKGS